MCSAPGCTTSTHSSWPEISTEQRRAMDEWVRVAEGVSTEGWGRTSLRLWFTFFFFFFKQAHAGRKERTLMVCMELILMSGTIKIHKADLVCFVLLLYMLANVCLISPTAQWARCGLGGFKIWLQGELGGGFEVGMKAPRSTPNSC